MLREIARGTIDYSYRSPCENKAPNAIRVPGTIERDMFIQYPVKPDEKPFRDPEFFFVLIVGVWLLQS